MKIKLKDSKYKDLLPQREEGCMGIYCKCISKLNQVIEEIGNIEIDEPLEKLDRDKLFDFFINVIHLYEPLKRAGAIVNGKDNSKDIVKNIIEELCQKFGTNKIEVDEVKITNAIKEYLDNYSDGYAVYDKSKLAKAIKQELEKE